MSASVGGHHRRSREEIRRIVRWYIDDTPERTKQRPFYCDAQLVGGFAVDPEKLAAGEDATLFRLFVALSMYQGLRDVVVMRLQGSLPRTAIRVVADAAFVRRSLAEHQCHLLRSPEAFEGGCNVWKGEGRVDCDTHPGLPCHVKDATMTFRRMGDMGKLPTSAWLRFWSDGGVRKLLANVCLAEPSPTKRAALLVERFALVYRVGRKLGTMFVGALSTPALAPGLTPWFPAVDGNELVVVDTNVARAVDVLRGPREPKTYSAREQWVREQAAQLDLREIRLDLPSYSPRLVQQALYAFCSKSNRIAKKDRCSQRQGACSQCTPLLCPFRSVS